MSLNNEGDQLDQSNAEEHDQTPSRGSKKWIGAAAAAAVVVALTVGGVAVVNALSGGGSQPEDVLPANAMAFTKLDLNPSAGQKLASFQLASKFPKAKEKMTSQDTSIKDSIFGSLFTGSESGMGLDYKKDVAPWLGDRIGVGVFPDMDGDKDPEFAVAIAYTNQSAAKAALDKAAAFETKRMAKANAGLPDRKADTTGYAFAEGYVIVSDTNAHATALVDAGKAGALAKSQYAEDVKSLGADQIGVAWTDVAAVYKAVPKDGQTPFGLLQAKGSKNPSGRIVMGLHADPSFLEVTGKGLDIKGLDTLVKPGAGTQASLVSSFPSDVLGAVTIKGLGKAAGSLYTSMTGDGMGFKSMLSELGITSAKQIETLLGDETGLVASGTTEQPGFAIRTRSSESDAALVIARKAISSAPDGQMGLVAKKITGPDGIVVSMGPDVTKALFDPSGPKLGNDEAFRLALPDAAKADATEYVNFGKLMPLITEANAKDSDWLKPLSSMGMSGTWGAEPTFRFRLTVK